jgi:hypothetical protein
LKGQITYIMLSQGVEELVSEFTARDPVDGFMSCLIAILYFGTIYALEGIGQSILFRPWFREILADYAYPVCFPTLSTTGYASCSL